MKFVYEPIEANSYVSIVYCTKEELFQENGKNSLSNYIPIDKLHDGFIPLYIIDKNEFICIKYVSKYQDWIIYCHDKNLHLKPVTESVKSYLSQFIKKLDKDKVYLGFLFGEQIYLLQEVNVFNNKVTRLDHCRTGSIIKPEQFYKICALNPKGGLIYFNSSDPMDLILSCLKFCSDRTGDTNCASRIDKTTGVNRISHSDDYNNIVDMIKMLWSDKYYHNIIPMINNLELSLNKIRDSDCLPAYKTIYKYFKLHDREYYESKIHGLHKEVYRFLNFPKENSDKKPNKTSDNLGGTVRTSQADQNAKIKFLIDLISGIKNDLSMELVLIYHRFRLHPIEKEVLAKNHPNHPYLTIFKILQNKFSELKKNKSQLNKPTNLRSDSRSDSRSEIRNDKSVRRVDLEVVRSTFFTRTNNDNFVVNDEYINLLLSAMRFRSDIFDMLYQAYLNSYTNHMHSRFKTEHDYFPFKVFSARLYVFEHLLRM